MLINLLLDGISFMYEMVYECVFFWIEIQIILKAFCRHKPDKSYKVTEHFNYARNQNTFFKNSIIFR